MYAVQSSNTRGNKNKMTKMYLEVRDIIMSPMTFMSVCLGNKRLNVVCYVTRASLSKSKPA
jgi:hypothetical protein